MRFRSVCVVNLKDDKLKDTSYFLTKTW